MAHRTHIDHFAFRSHAQPEHVLAALRAAFGPVGESIKLQRRDSGWQGYTQAATVQLSDMHIGLMAYGGTSQNGSVYTSLSGSGCQWVHDWDTVQEETRKLPGFAFSRVDIALDTFQREVTHESVVSAYRAGLFTTRGRPPKMRQYLSEDPEDGRTVYVGVRDTDKFGRFYEKGLEVAGKSPKGLRTTHIDGVPVHDWYRLELELKAKTSPLPADLVDRRDSYFAGAYPYLAQVLPAVAAQSIKRVRRKTPHTELEALLALIRHQYGTHLFTACAAYGDDVAAVWKRIVGTRHNEALLAAGVLLVDHE